VIGVEVAGIDGTIARAGGMVVKNVTGFDMMHLHYGALGAFGVVTRLNLKVFPQPGASRSIAFAYEEVANAHAAAVALLRSQLQPSSILIANDDGWRVHVRIDAPPTAIDSLVNRVIETADEAAFAWDTAIDESGDAAVAPFVSAVDLTSGKVVARVPVVATRQIGLLMRVEPGSGVAVCADLGSGLIYLVASSKQEVAEILIDHDVQPTWLSLSAGDRQNSDVFGPFATPAADVVRRLKDEFDPDRLLNPGRFVLGL
jgi:glycolate oxidase FAD binding subunit